ncbi:MAG: hypothetical protein ABI647_18590 [Gemmatimonadota bacterium]
MILLALALAVAPQDTVPKSAPAADTYANPATADLVARARAARERNERLVTAYTATVSQRMGVGIRALSRDRMLFSQELAAKISWKRDGKSSIEVTGARQSIPIAFRDAQVPEDLDDDVRWLVVNPAEDYLRIIGAEAEEGFVYPLREGGEKDYKYAIGDTTVLAFATGKKVRLIKLEVTPRRSEWKLMAGALWFDADTYGLVRAVFRPARPYEFRRDAEKDDQKDVPSFVNPVAEVKYVTLEYGLYEGRWWMLRYAAIDAVGKMGSWLGMPVRFERVYADYEVEGGTPPDPNSTFRPAGTTRDRDRRNDEPKLDSVARRARSDSIEKVVSLCIDAARKEAEAEGTRGYQKGRVIAREARQCSRRSYRRDQDSALAVIIPEDTLALLKSPTLGEPILQMGDLITESELRGLADAIKQLPGAPSGTHIELPRGVSSLLQNARYNRIEGLSLGARGSLQTGGLTAEGTARIGSADLVPNAELSLTRPTTNTRLRLGAYRRLAAMNPDTRPFGPVNSVMGLIAQRDDGEYFRTLGAELVWENVTTGWWSWRFFAEQQRPAFVETNASLPRLFSSVKHFRGNLAADSATQFGASFTLRGNRVLSRTVSLGGDATLDAVGGDFRYGRGSGSARLIVTPHGPIAVAAEVGAGTSAGTVPVQRRFFLGGPATLRGYTGAAESGSAFWRGRVEVGNSFPAFRVTAFSDIGWAGDRRDFSKGKPLLGAGGGISMLDGLIRADLSRRLRGSTGWRFDFYFDGRL